ncbi:phage tail protein [Taibaiella koreensis]|uniref:phage tail protein n=1 Tax=Taibaiella koreensis TaxID=1268548 RepID=UPI000E59CEE3|nr:tail fiber protein [Taibaiella koreensis]
MFVDPYLATVTIFAGNFAPLSWAFCNGSLQSIAANTALYALLGTTYGGDGVTTFALPDLRGRSAVGTGQGPGQPNYILGQAAGTEQTTLLSSNLPMHNHVVLSVTGAPGAFNDSGNQSNPAGNVPADFSSRYTTVTGDGQLAPTSALSNTPIAGGSTPVSNLSPYLAMNYIICTEGIFPSRN